MKISVSQVVAEGRNEFEIFYDDILKYKAQVPFIKVDEALNLEKLRTIKVFDLDDGLLYSTAYDYMDNLKEIAFPFKYLLTGSQKFNQIVFFSEKDCYKIYFEERDIWDNRYVIEAGEEKVFVYSVEDGYARHFPVYVEDEQVGEGIKSNVMINGKDEYALYLKDEYSHMAMGLTALFLYLDCLEYDSSYLLNRSYSISKKFSYNENNRYYDKNWLLNNFGDEFYKKLDRDIDYVRGKTKKPLKATIDELKSLTPRQRGLLKLILLGVGTMLVITILIFIVVIFFSS